MPRRFPIFQFPNRPVIATMLGAVLGRVTRGRPSAGAKLLSLLAMLVWSAEELASGANWFRRLLGAGAAGYALATLARTGAIGRLLADDSAAPTGETASAL